MKWAVDARQSLSGSLIRDSFMTCALTKVVGGSDDKLIRCFKSGQPCRSAWDLLQNSRYEGQAADLAVIAVDFATPALSESFQDDKDPSSDEIIQHIDKYSDEEYPLIDTNQ